MAGFAIAVLLAGCGVSGPSQPPGSIAVNLTEYKFDPASIKVKHGKVVFYLINLGTGAHDMIIKDGSGNTVAGSDLIPTGEALVFTVNDIAAGTYTYICDQPGHEAAGMHGSLTVT